MALNRSSLWMGRLFHFHCSIQESNDRNRDKQIGPPLDRTLEQMSRLASTGHNFPKLVGGFYASHCYRSVNSLRSGQRKIIFLMQMSVMAELAVFVGTSGSR